MFYVGTKSKENPAERLKAGVKANAGRDLGIASEWFPADEEAWQKPR